MAYARDDIDRVRAASSLVDLAAEVTKVKKSGRSVMAVCPFHREKTPSLSIDAERGLYHCFGCGKSGDVFRWVQETQGVDFVGALELLARRAGIQLQEEPGAARRRGRREELVSAVEAAVAFYHRRLRSAPDAGGARSYLRGRGYEVDVVDRFVLGYSPAEWDVLTRALRSDGVGEEALVGAGLAVKSRTGRLVDRFRGRLMFPIYDLRGDAVGFGARLLEGDDGPKYLNSPETAIYQKSRLLYGLNWSKGDIVRSGRAVVVEGYTDVIAFHLAGDPVAVATCGTALGEDHLDLLRRFTERVVLAFDADAAGAGAALRGFEVAVPGDLDLRVAQMPEGRDPADLVAGGRADLLGKAVDESEPLLQFRIERELERFDLDEPEARGRAVRAAAAVIARHPDALIRHEYAVVLARRTGVDLGAVEQAVAAAVRTAGTAPPARERPAPQRLSGQDKVEREVLRLLLANDPSARSDELTVDLFDRPEHVAAYELVAPAVLALEPGDPPDLGALLGDDESDVGRMLRELALTDRPLESADELIIRLKRGALKRRIDEVRRDLERLDAGAEPEEYSSRFAELIALERHRQGLGKME